MRRRGTKTRDWGELAELRFRLQEAEDTLNAIRSGSIDALVVRTPRGEQLFTLKGADHTYRTLVEAMTGGAVTLRGRIVSYCNRHFATMLQMPHEEVMGACITDLIQADGFARLLNALQKGRTVQRSMEAVLCAADGTRVPVLLSASRFMDEGSVAVCLVVTDLRKTKEAEAALRASEERFQIVASMSSDAIWDWDMVTNRTWRSSTFAAIFKFRPDRVGGDFVWWRERIHPDDREAVLKALSAASRSESGRFSAVYRFRRGDGTYAYVSDRGRVLWNPAGRPVRMIGALTDITEQRKTELARRQLSRSILNAQEHERQRVARDLHDGVNQLLSSAKYRLASVAARDAAVANGEVAQAHRLIERAINEVRLISRNLRPSELDDLGLVAALRSLAHDFRKRTAIAVAFRNQLSAEEVPREVEMTLYRVAQEALSNVEKHSGASRVLIHLAGGRGDVVLSVRDNGRGMPFSGNGSGNGGSGLQNMNERASLLGGVCEVRSIPRQGTQVRIGIPLSRGAETEREGKR